MGLPTGSAALRRVPICEERGILVASRDFSGLKPGSGRSVQIRLQHATKLPMLSEVYAPRAPRWGAGKCAMAPTTFAERVATEERMLEHLNANEAELEA